MVSHGRQEFRDPARRRTATWAAILAVVAGVLAFAPGTDVLSFYFCLVVAPILGMASGGVAVTAVSAGRESGLAMPASWGRALRSCAVLIAVPLAVILLNGLRVPPCDTGYGLLFYAIGPALSAAFGCLTGVALATLIARRRLAHAAFILFYVMTFAFNLYDLYWHPAVFFYNPFLGLYPGAIYDERIEIGAAYAGFRVFCIALAGAIAALAWVLRGRDFSLRVSRSWWPYLLLGTSAGVASVLWVHAADLGFRVTRDDVERVLSGEVSDEYCSVRHDPALDPDQARRLLADCGFRHRQMAAFFGLPPGDPVRLYVYRDEDQKARLMGARHTEISKPWLNEVHMAAFLPGDPVLGHEVAHVVAGRLAPDFLAVPLRWGVVPDLPVVEGLAVAAAFASEGPSPHEWSLAMLRAGLPADPTALWRADAFLLAQAPRAYTLAGSFLRFVADWFGTGAIRDLAAGQSLEQATGSPIRDLVAEWRAHLEDVAAPTVDADLVRRASGRFEGPGVLGRRCPVDIARRVAAADRAEKAGDPACAAREIEAALALDPENRPLARERLVLRARAGDEDGTHEALSALAGAGMPEAWQDLVSLADALALMALRRGDAPDPHVRAALEQATERAGPGPAGRAVAARIAALDLPAAAALRVVAVLGGHEDHPAWTLMEALAHAPDAGILFYLLGRALVGEGDYPAAVRHLRLALAFRLPSPAFDIEAHRVLGEAAFWAGDADTSRRHLLRALDDTPHEGERMRIEEFLERLGFVTPPLGRYNPHHGRGRCPGSAPSAARASRRRSAAVRPTGPPRFS